MPRPAFKPKGKTDPAHDKMMSDSYGKGKPTAPGRPPGMSKGKPKGKGK